MREIAQNKRSPKSANFLSGLWVFIILFAFWLLFSGKFDVFHISLGIFSCLLVTVFSRDLMFPEFVNKQNTFAVAFRFLVYLPWLIYQVVLANIHVAYLVLNPKAIDPEVIKFDTFLKSDFAKVTFANSITLTPGTITMDVDGNKFYVHALSKKVADDLKSGDMERKIAAVFGENKKW